MRELWAQTKAFGLAVGVHVLMAAMVVLGTMTWKPFKPPTITGMTIEAVMVDTGAIKKRREEARGVEREILGKGREEAQVILEGIRSEIQQESTEARGRLREEAAGLSRILTEKLLGRPVS